MPKHFINSPDITDNRITLTGETAHHLLRVLRIKPGERVVLCDGQRTDYDCIVEQVLDKNLSLSLTVHAVRACDTETAVRVTLYQSLPKSDKLEWIIQKCVELGVHAIVPVITEYSVVRVNKDWKHKGERYQRIAEAAAAQSMRGIIPVVCDPVSFSEAITSSREEMQIYAYEKERERSVSHALRGKRPASVGIWIGPEGGFSDDESACFNAVNGVAVTLGRRILRTETAGLAALTQVLCVLEEL